MGAFSSFGEERFTGIFLGRFFSICYHSGWEWNRKLTNEKNRAIGYVRSTPAGTEVRFIRLYGLTNPISLASLFLFGYMFSWLIIGFHSLRNNVSPAMEEIQPIFCLVAGVLVMLAVALETALGSRLTERGQYGQSILMTHLKDPKDPWGRAH